ncbi:MAG: hypothetical protein NTU98_10965 [Bacteroidetes bacterium]|nr:hypothetical protein [Bacteroidota bacterium]
MKNFILFLSLLFLSVIILSSGCKKKTESTPCDGKGTLCIENKLDSTITITLKPSQSTFDLQKDYMQCSDLTGDQTYTINVSGNGIDRDTTITVLTCDKKLLIIQ